MTPSSDRHDARLTLRQSLGRTHLVTAFTSACVAGILLTLTSPAGDAFLRRPQS